MGKRTHNIPTTRGQIQNMLIQAQRMECRNELNYPTVEVASELLQDMALLALYAMDNGAEIEYPVFDANNLLECV